MSSTYKITTSGLSIMDGEQLASSVFANYGTHTDLFFDPQGVVIITFRSPQTPTDLGPLVKVETVSQ